MSKKLRAPLTPYNVGLALLQLTLLPTRYYDAPYADDLALVTQALRESPRLFFTPQYFGSEGAVHKIVNMICNHNYAKDIRDALQDALLDSYRVLLAKGEVLDFYRIIDGQDYDEERWQDLARAVAACNVNGRSVRVHNHSVYHGMKVEQVVTGDQRDYVMTRPVCAPGCNAARIALC